MKRLLSTTLGLALLALGMPLAVFAGNVSHSTANNASCAECHNTSAPSNSATFNSACLTCHGTSGSASIKLADNDQANTSHRWSGNVTNPNAGAQSPAKRVMTQVVDDYTGNELSCVNCHTPHNNRNINITSDLRINNGADQMCMDCHRSRNVQRHNAAGSHPVYIGYSTSLRTSPASFNATIVNSNSNPLTNAKSDLNTYLDANGTDPTQKGLVLCTTCHGVHNVAKASDNITPGVGGSDLLRTNSRGASVAAKATDNSNLCTNCHAGKINHNAKGQDVQCNDCHGGHVDYDSDDPTGAKGINQSLIRRNVFKNGVPGKIYYTVAGSFKNANGTGVCQGCHDVPTGTANYGALHDSQSATSCTTCHTHSNAFTPNMACGSCHAVPPTTTNAFYTGAKSKYYTHKTTDTSCDNCHSSSSAASHNNGEVDLLTNANACSVCHSFPPASAAHSSATTSPINCSNCHIYTGFNGAMHNNGTIDISCTGCHGYPPATQVIHTTGAMKYTHDKQGINYSNCYACHGSSNHNNTNKTIDILTNNNACNSCHSTPPASTAHSSATLAPFNCTGCHVYTDYHAITHNNGSIDFSGSLSCDTCHGYPPLPLAQLNARPAGAFVNARFEDYSGGGGHHASHLLSTVTASEGFTPCLPCHPSTYHGQGGGTVVKTNVNVFDAADMNFRFDDTRPKRYEVATQSCSNVSCHYQPTVSWR